MFDVLMNDQIVAGPYETAQEANAVAQQYRTGAEKGTKVRIAPMKVDTTALEAAKAREAQRMRDGTYHLLPDWFPLKHDLYPHASRLQSQREEGTVVIVPNVKYLLDDRHRRISAGTYLNTYFPDLTPAEVQAMVERLRAHYSGLSFEIVSDAATIYNAYRSQVMHNEASRSLSCMHYDFNVSADKHPCAVYGEGSDLHLAVVRKESRLVGRSLVNIKENYFVRVYGETSTVQVALAKWLEENNFTRRGHFAGSRLKYVPVRGDLVAMPYIDGDEKGVDLREDTDGGKYWVVDCDGAYSGEITGGAVSLDDTRADTCECENCGDDYDARTGYDVVTRVASGGRPWRTQVWCEHCYSNSTWVCDYTGDTMSEDICSIDVVVDRYLTHMGAWRLREGMWTEEAASAHGFLCERTDRHYDGREFDSVTVYVDNIITSQTWVRFEADEHAFLCTLSGDRYYKGDFTQVRIDGVDGVVCLEWLIDGDIEHEVDEYRPEYVLLSDKMRSALNITITNL